MQTSRVQTIQRATLAQAPRIRFQKRCVVHSVVSPSRSPSRSPTTHSLTVSLTTHSLTIPSFSPHRALAHVPRAAATDDEYKLKYPSWESIQPELTSKYTIDTVSVEQAKDLLAAGGHVLLDVRPTGQYEEAHPAGAINVPAFRVIEGGKNGMQSFMRFAVMSLNGVTPTEANPDFVEQLENVVAENQGKTFLFICREGGTLTPSTTFPFGKVSRSLKAIWRALHNGAKVDSGKMVHVEGGIRAWAQAGFDMEQSS